ncbi:MAG TPA: acyltransferase [Polyangiales bacterium]|nr:acyltransferase [Polyangiales bacterium]
MGSQSSFNRALNGYRGFCALLVFVFHAGNAGVISTAELGVIPDFVWTSLRYGVEMFFMISGYVILGSLLRHASIGQFLSDRFIRIYSAWLPALVSVSLVCALFNAKMFQGMIAPERFRLFLANLLLLPPFVPLPLVHRGSWSLSYEWVFYFTAAVGAALQRQRAGEGRWVTGIYLLLAATFVFLFPRSTFFLTGVVVFMNAEWFERRRQWLQMPLLSMFVFLIAWRFTTVDEAELTITYWDFLGDYRWLAAIVAFVASLHMFACVVYRSSRQFSFLDSRVFQFLGRISYSFYLWHTLVMSVIKRLVTPFVVPHVGVGIGFSVFVLASGAVSLAISWLSWTLFEVRMAQAAQRIVSAMKAPQRSRAA